MHKIGDDTPTADINDEFQEIPDPTDLRAAWANTIQRELVHLVEQAGLVLSGADDTQVYQAVQAFIRTANQRVIIPNAVFAPGVADGDAVYWDSGNSRYDQAIADNTAARLVIGFADVTGATVSAFGLWPGGFAGLTPGARYYLSDSAAGAITSTPPAVRVLVGLALTATDLYIDIDDEEAERVVIGAAVFAPGVADGDAVYWDSGNSRFDQAIADGSAAQHVIGFADVTRTSVVALGSSPPWFAGLTPGAQYYLSAAIAGDITPVPPINVVPVGMALGATYLHVNITTGLPRESVLINGSFEIWQRGTSFLAFDNAGQQFTADRWFSTPSLGGICDVTRQAFTLGQTDVPGEPHYYLRHAQTTGATAGKFPVEEQRIEGVHTLSGTLTISCWLKADAALAVTAWLRQDFGIGGTPSADVYTAASPWAVGTTWQRFTATLVLPSIAGKTLGTNGDDHIAMRLEMPDQATFVLDIAQVAICPGPVPGAPPKRSPAAELDLCQRYYLTGATGLSGYSNASYPHQVKFQFPKRMRAAPTITTLLSGSSGMAAAAVGYTNIDDYSADWTRSKDGSAGMFFQNIKYAADAELL